MANSFIRGLFFFFFTVKQYNSNREKAPASLQGWVPDLYLSIFPGAQIKINVLEVTPPT